MTAKLVTIQDLSQHYSAHRKTIEKWVRCGIIPAIKINPRCVRFDVEKCDAALNRRSTR